MTPIKQEDHLKIRKALAAAYRNKESTDAEQGWPLKVMGNIRRLGNLYVKTSYLERFQRSVWKLAPVACVLLLLLSVAMTRFDFILDFEMEKIYIEDPADFGLLAFYTR